jgi:hypothetical protein
MFNLRSPTIPLQIYYTLKEKEKKHSKGSHRSRNEPSATKSGHFGETLKTLIQQWINKEYWIKEEMRTPAHKQRKKGQCNGKGDETKISCAHYPSRKQQLLDLQGRRNEATGHRFLMRNPLLKRQPELLELAVGAAELQEESC